jgi:hypothetical protein
VTLQEPNNPPFADVDIPDTQVIDVAPPSPVFVDSTGRRRRLLRRIAYGFGALCMLYGGLISVSLAGGPVSSSAVLPLPGLTDDDDDKDVVLAKPSPTPAPTTTRPDGPHILEAFPRRNAPVTRTTEAGAVLPRSSSASARPSASPSPKPTTKKPTPKQTTPKPVESTTTTPAGPGPVVTTTDPTPPPPVPPAQPAPPLPPAQPPAGGSGGSGGSDDGPVRPAEPPRPPAPDPDPESATTPKPQPKPQPDPGPEPSGEATP